MSSAVKNKNQKEHEQGDSRMSYWKALRKCDNLYILKLPAKSGKQQCNMASDVLKLDRPVIFYNWLTKETQY